MIEKDQISELAHAPVAPEGISPSATTPLAAPPSGADRKLERLRLYMEAAKMGMAAEQLAGFRAMMKEDDEKDDKEQFYTALAQAKAEFTPIVKKHLVDFQHKDGRGRTSYKYEELADITDIVTPVLAKYGITHRFKVDQSDKPKIKVKCVLAHANGYEVEGDWFEGVDDSSGQKNPNQAIASTVTYFERQALKAALGIAAGRDDDGASDAEEDPQIKIDDVVYLETLIRDTDSNLEKFLDFVKAPSIAEMRVSQFKKGGDMLVRKKREMQEKADATAQ